MNNSASKLSRRTVLRGMLGSGAVYVGLPVLDFMLDGNGAALASTGKKLPTCFATWFWGLGLAPGYWEPRQVGRDYELRDHLKVFEPIKDKINIYSGTQVFLDGKVNQNHYSGAQGTITGHVSRDGGGFRTSLDQTIYDAISPRTRFRSIEVACDGRTDSSWSARGEAGMNPAEISPVQLYSRIFGPEFKDPNAAGFVPDPKIQLRHSVLSMVADDRKKLMNEVGASDRIRLEEYFASIRDLERKLEIELERPPALPACSPPPNPAEAPEGTLIDDGMRRHNLFIDILTQALACGQTRFWNLSISQSMSGLRRPGDPAGNHTHTHEEPIDPALGYQPICKWFADQYMQGFRYMVESLDAVKEGDGTLLDRCLVFAFTDHGEARLHSMKEAPLFTAGRANGKLKTGYHIAAKGDPATRLGLTVQLAMGMPVSNWGTESNNTRNPFTEVLT